MSQRSLRLKIRDEEAALAYVRRLQDSAAAIRAHAGEVRWPVLREQLDAYVEDLDKHAAEIDAGIVEMIGRLRKPMRRRR